MTVLVRETALLIPPNPRHTSLERGPHPCASASAPPPHDPGEVGAARVRPASQWPKTPIDGGWIGDGAAPTGGSSFVEVLCERHRSWVTNRVKSDRLPIGWRVLVEQTFADIAGVADTQRYVLHRLDAEVGGLAVTLVPENPTRITSSPAHPQVLNLLQRARIASRRLCQVCGRTASPQAGSVRETLCPDHAHTTTALLDNAPRVDVASKVGGDAVDAGRRDVGGHQTMSTRIRLYRTSDVAAALDPQGDDPTEPGDGGTTEHATTLRRILRRGEDGSWRTLAVPTREQVGALDALDLRAPHFGQVTALVRRHVMAAIAMDMHLTLPALLLVGEPGFGKTWYVSSLAAALGLPVRMLSMNSASLGDSVTGSYPVWRNARMGLVARTLLGEEAANPLFLVDEIDKPVGHNREDPYRPFYTVLEPGNAKALVDDYLGFALDASHATWVLAGNAVQNLPAPIVDRLVVMNIPAMDDAQRRAVATSVYAEANTSARDYFDPALSDDVADRLASLTARGMRRSLADAMVRAAGAGRRVLLPDDVVDAPRPTRRPIGFGPWS